MTPSNIKDNARIAVTHGELCLTPVDTIPEGVTTAHVKYVAAHSETGHHHVIESKEGFDLITKDNERYLLIKDVAKLFHQKTFDIHETRFLAPGAYKITEKQEYDPFAKVVRRVFD